MYNHSESFVVLYEKAWVIHIVTSDSPNVSRYERAGLSTAIAPQPLMSSMRTSDCEGLPSKEPVDDADTDQHRL